MTGEAIAERDDKPAIGDRYLNNKAQKCTNNVFVNLGRVISQEL